MLVQSPLIVLGDAKSWRYPSQFYPVSWSDPHLEVSEVMGVPPNHPNYWCPNYSIDTTYGDLGIPPWLKKPLYPH